MTVGQVIGWFILLIGVGALLFWLHRLWRTRPWRGPRPRYPVVLVHGILGFDEIGIGTAKQKYFRGIAEHLASLGITLHRPLLPKLASIEQRARILAQVIEALPCRRVNIIAHSMGGLDARMAISQLGVGRKAASLTTIGTPHRGTPIADLGANLFHKKYGLGRLLGALGVGVDAIDDLTSARMKAFNEQVPDVRGVRYFCVPAGFDQHRNNLHPLLTPSHAYLRHSAGASDGLVPVDSQRWGHCLDPIEADHWAQIGWSNSSTFDAPGLYESLLLKLRRSGL